MPSLQSFLACLLASAQCKWEPIPEVPSCVSWQCWCESSAAVGLVLERSDEGFGRHCVPFYLKGKGVRGHPYQEDP